MNSTDKVAYSVLYANAQRNSYANATLNAVGERAWKRVFKNDLDEPMAPPVAVLAHNGYIGVQVNPYFLIYRDGLFVKWHNSYESSADVGLFLNSCYTVFLHHGSIEALYKYDGTILNNEIAHAGISYYCYPLLLYPYKNGFLSAEQFTGGPSRQPKKFDISYDVPGENLGVWFYGEKGVISNVLLTPALDNLIFTFQNKIHLLDPATGKKTKVFDPELSTMFKASLDLSNNLVIHAITKDRREVYVSFDLNGTKLWEHEIDGSVQNGQPPVCGEGGTVYYIADSSLICLKAGKILWKSEVFPCVKPLLTNSRGNNIVVQSGFHLMTYDCTGKQKFKTLITKNMDEEFTAPPVVGGDGRIYTASGTALYCFR